MSLRCQKRGYETVQPDYSTYKYQYIVSVIKTGTNAEEVVLECKKYNKIQGTARLKQTRRNYRTYVDRVSREEQKQKLPSKCFLPTSS